MYCQMISKLDNSLNTLKNCKKLSLSTNCIDRLNVPLAGMSSLKILSLGRNNIKKIEKLEDVAETLEELWISYNQITTLDGLSGERAKRASLVTEKFLLFNPCDIWLHPLLN